MIEIPEGFEIEPVEGSPFLNEVDLQVCVNCGAESTHVAQSGKKKGFCPMCEETT